MLPKNSRIKRKEFFSILKTGKRYNTPHLLLYVAKRDIGDKSKNTKFSFSVSKKVAKNASDRNKLRRQGYNIIKEYLGVVEENFLLFFSFKKESLSLSFKTLEKEITQLLSISGVLK